MCLTVVRRAFRPGVVALALSFTALPAAAQVAAPRPAGRVSFFVSASQIKGAGADVQTTEFITSVTYGLTERQTNGLEFDVDLRQSQPMHTTAGRRSRFSVYDGYVGVRLLRGALRLRGGQMWLTDLGSLGSVTGGLAEYRSDRTGRVGRLRVGAFGGIEPNTYEFGYTADVWKAGGYAAVEGAGGRRHVVGYVRIDHGGLAERSVATFTNFVPVRSRVFVYQIAEYELAGPGGEGSGGLSYFFLNARATVHPRVDLQGLFNRGRSVDARTITDDLLRGRAVSTTALDGLLYESAGGRVTVTVLPRVRAHVGYTRDRNNRDSAATRRLSLGGSAQDVARTGFDVTVTDSKIDRPTGTYHSLYASFGRQIGRSTYLSADYTSAVSILRYTRLDGLTVEMRPFTKHVGGSATVTLNRSFSLFATATRTIDDDTRELRVFAGATYRQR